MFELLFIKKNYQFINRPSVMCENIAAEIEFLINKILKNPSKSLTD